MEHEALQYMQLYERLNPERDVPLTCTATIAELADILYCTPRNVKFVLRKLEERSWINWQPGRGRGNHSQLEFRCHHHELVEQQLEHLLSRDRVKDALELTGSMENDEPFRERLWQRINIYLGLHREQEESSTQDVLRMIRYRPLEELNTVKVFTAFEVFLLRQLFDTLVCYDPQQEDFVPRIAHRWEANDTYTEWTFYLRKGIRFHDGSLLTARDVYSTVERLRQRGRNISWLYSDMDKVVVHTDYTLTFYLAQPNAMFLHLLSNIFMGIVPEHEQGDETINGSGPFRIARRSASKLSLIAFDGYYGFRPMLDRVDVWFMPDEGHSNRYYRLSNGREEDEQYSRLINQPAQGGRYMLFNFNLPGVQHEAAFRQAIRLLYDRETMRQELAGDRISSAGSFLPWESAKMSFPSIPLEQVQQQLAQSSYAGETLKLTFVDKYEERREAEWLQQRAQQIGLQLELEPQERKLVVGGHMVLAVEVLEDDWEWDMINYFSNEANYLHHMLGEQQLEQIHEMLCDIMRKEQEERRQRLTQIVDRLQQENWLLFGNHINQRAYFNRNLYGLHLDSFGFPNLSALWIKNR